MLSDRDLSYVIDIVQSARIIRDYVKEVERSEFEAELMRQDAVIRRIEILGEAAKQLSGDFKSKYPEIPWKNIAGMRDVLIHDYRDIILERVWSTVTVAVPKLIAQLEALLPPDNTD